MKNPLSFLRKIVKDEVEFTSMVLPSAGIVSIFFIYSGDIHPLLDKIPDPKSDVIFGSLLFVVMTLVVAQVVKLISHDILNGLYDKLYRDPKRRKDRTSWYKRCSEKNLLENDKLKSQYFEIYKELKSVSNPVIDRVDSIQTLSKFSRSIAFFMMVFALISTIVFNYTIALFFLIFFFFMWRCFVRDRWKASELLYEAKYEMKYPKHN